jgi:hypothetical protein
MHCPFEAGLIVEPDQYHDGLTPVGRRSARVVTWTKTIYRILADELKRVLTPTISVPWEIGPVKQHNFRIIRDATRQYTIQTFGISDNVIVLLSKGSETSCAIAAVMMTVGRS